MKIYLASPFFKEEERKSVAMAAQMLRTKGHNVYLPCEHTIPNAWDYPNWEWGQMVFAADVTAIDNSEVVVVLSYGRCGTAGTSWEAGYAFGSGKKVIIVEMPGVTLMSLMIANGRYATVRGLDGLDAYDFDTMPQSRDDEMEQK